jgi:transcriptional regulator with XRE-family HTH domain
MSIITTVKLNFAHRLKNKVFRRKFFKRSAQDTVAAQIRELRNKRDMRQTDLAKAARMKQSAVSRIEQAEYSRWGFNTLTRIADALDARVRIIFEPAEDVIEEYERQERRRNRLAEHFEQSRKQAVFSVAMDQLNTAQSDRVFVTATGGRQELIRAFADPTNQNRQTDDEPVPTVQNRAAYLQ